MSNSQTKEPKDKKVRVFALAKELNLESKVLVELCKEMGFAGITNQLNGLDPDQIDSLKDRIKKGPKTSGVSAPAGSRPVLAAPPKLETKILTLPKAKPAPIPARAAAVEPTAASVPTVPVVAPEVPVPQPGPTVAPLEPVPAHPPLTVPEPSPAAPPEPEAPTPISATVEPILASAATVEPILASAASVPASIPSKSMPSLGGAGKLPNLSGRPQALAPNRMPNLNRPSGPTSAPPAAGPSAPPRPSVPAPPPPAPAAPPISAGSPAAPPASTPPRPAAPPPGGAGGPSRPSVLNRPPQVPPPRPGVTAPPRHGPGGSAGGGGGPQRTGGGQGGGQARSGGKSSGPAKPAAGTSVKLTPEMIDRLRKHSQAGQRMSIQEITKTPTAPPPGTTPPGGPGGGKTGPAAPTGRPTPPPSKPGGMEASDEEDDRRKGPGGGGVIGRGSRHAGRQTSGRARGPSSGQPAVVLGPDGVELIDPQFGSRRGPRAALLRKHMRGKAAPIVKEGKIEISPPIVLRSLSETIGMKAGELGKRLLKETGQLYGVNSPIDFNIAALIAAEKNIELVLKQQKSAEDILLENFEKMVTDVDPSKFQPRPPIVTIMGHVDHGKTSLLDKIRSSKIAEGEVGGITQVIRAWSVLHKIDDPDNPGEKLIERPITFLDTPGHEAFTKMRARGANVTDIAVIVVAATDGVMPQTEEAIAHARAADVRIIVAINKVDMPNANVERTRRQLYGLNLLPDDMGGDTQFVETSAVTGQGIDDLLTAILLEAELNLNEELKADPDRPATGTCLEAYMTSDEGVMATILVQQGTLQRGDIVLCGSTFGRIRAMYSDMGMAVQEAGPSTPVRITGLNEVPNADDPFYVVEELATAQEIAEVRRQKEREAALNRFAPVSLESLTASKSKIKISELKVILKAEARGSVEAIRKELEKLTHEEVRTRVLHAAIGGITESDVQLALTSPDDTLIVGFNVTADDAALRLVEEYGLPPIREYNIIYNLVDDIKAALEGRLKPIKEVVHLGRAVVRETFKISKVGTIAGCYVTSGTIERSAKVRLIREGIVVFPQGEKEVGLDSLKRFKEDVKEVREGFECGMKIDGYDNIKVGDVIEAYKIEMKSRTL